MRELPGKHEEAYHRQSLGLAERTRRGTAHAGQAVAAVGWKIMGRGPPRDNSPARVDAPATCSPTSAGASRRPGGRARRTAAIGEHPARAWSTRWAVWDRELVFRPALLRPEVLHSDGTARGRARPGITASPNHPQGEHGLALLSRPDGATVTAIMEAVALWNASPASSDDQQDAARRRARRRAERL
jgi:hypothetical protein